MIAIDSAVPCDDQPIGGDHAATLFHESRYLTSWVTPDNLEVQEKYSELTRGIASQEERISALWNYVKSIPYTQFLSTKITIDGKTFEQKDTWLEPAQSIKVKRLNCFNKSVLLASLLRQELPPDQVYVWLGNLKLNGVGGHAITYIRLAQDYALETTNPRIMSPFLKAADLDEYETVMFMNDQDIKYVPDTILSEPLGICCVRFLEDYLNDKLCTAYV